MFDHPSQRQDGDRVPTEAVRLLPGDPCRISQVTDEVVWKAVSLHRFPRRKTPHASTAVAIESRRPARALPPSLHRYRRSLRIIHRPAHATDADRTDETWAVPVGRIARR